MVDTRKNRLRKGVERFRRQFGDQPTQALGAVLPARALQRLVDEEVGSFRERIYPLMTTLGLFIGQALSPDGACQDAVARRLSERTARGEMACSLNSGPYCKARKRLLLELIRRLALKVGETLGQEIPVDWKWRGRSVKLMDGTTISMPDTASNQSVDPQRGVQQAGLGFPLAMLVAVISLSTGAILEWVLGPCRGKTHGRAGAVSRVDATTSTWRHRPGPPLSLQLLHRRAADGAGRRSGHAATPAPDYRLPARPTPGATGSFGGLDTSPTPRLDGRRDLCIHAGAAVDARNGNRRAYSRHDLERCQNRERQGH